LTGPTVLRPISALLRRFAPILLVGKRAVVSRHADVVEVLSRDTDFTVSQINAPNINRLDGPFILGMDRSAQYDREAGLLHQAVRREDLDRIRSFVASQAEELIAARRSRQRLDVVNDVVRVVAVRVVATYFGMPGPDEATMMGWLRDIFHDVFLNLNNNAEVRAAALRSGNALRAHMDLVIAKRKSQPAAATPPDDVLGRLLALEGAANPWLDDDTVRRNLSGLIVGAVETTSTLVTQALAQLLRRPQEMARARAAALAGDIENVKRYAYEAARFHPQAPIMFRFCPAEAELAAGTPRARRIPAGTTLVLGTLSAMFDPEGFVSPKEFRIDRNVEYLHFGFGMHRCFGHLINAVQIPEVMAALLRLPRLRRAHGGDGCLKYQGPFPQRMLVEFDQG
jgi:cytochrome P450